MGNLPKVSYSLGGRVGMTFDVISRSLGSIPEVTKDFFFAFILENLKLGILMQNLKFNELFEKFHHFKIRSNLQFKLLRLFS